DFQARADLALTANFTPAIGQVLLGLNQTETRTSLPSIRSNFHLDWDLSGSDPRAGLGSLGGRPNVALNDVQVGLGSFLSTALDPLRSGVQRSPAPLDPVLKVLDAPIPLLSDLGLGKVSLLRLADQAADFLPPPLQVVVNLATDLVDLVQAIDAVKSDAGNV